VSKRSVGLIWAQAANGVIGCDGRLPWHLPEDLAHFRATTHDNTVVMGHRTWESLPPKVRPLPGRTNIVLTNQSGWAAPGAATAHSLTEALELATGDVWVIGGATVYATALDHADKLVVTELQGSFPGDVHAPALTPVWQRRDSDCAWQRSSSGLHYRFITYRRSEHCAEQSRKPPEIAGTDPA